MISAKEKEAEMEVSGEDPAVINKAVSADLAEVTLREDLTVGRLSCVGTRVEKGSGRGRETVETAARAVHAVLLEALGRHSE